MLQSFLCIGPFDQTWVHYATLGAMVLHEVELFLGPLKSCLYQIKGSTVGLTP